MFGWAVAKFLVKLKQIFTLALHSSKCLLLKVIRLFNDFYVLLLELLKKLKTSHQDLILWRTAACDLLLQAIMKSCKQEEKEKREDVHLGLSENLNLGLWEWQPIVLSTTPCLMCSSFLTNTRNKCNFNNTVFGKVK